jgi:aldose 1-epimerase
LLSSITKKIFGWIGDQEINEYTIENNNGMRVSIINYGGAITEITTVDKNGESGNVVLRFDNLTDYLKKENPYLGPLIGRYANRIGAAKFAINNNHYNLEANDNNNTLHGGFSGFDKAVWEVTTIPTQGALQLNYFSKDGEGGFPGDINVQVTYALNNDNAFTIGYEATTNKPTPVSLTSHAYFNLSAGLQSNVLNHSLHLNAQKFIPVNAQLIPTGEILSVANSPMDFTNAHFVGDQISHVKGGYDHSWILDKQNTELSLAATVYEPVSGRFLKMYTTEPAVQFYSGNFLDGTLGCNNGATKFEQYGALCLEAQRFPDSPNQANFPNTILIPGEVYHQTTIYQFSVK